jgi:hypothetical protein
MGGPGSGSRYHWWRHGKKVVVEHCLALDAVRWQRAGILAANVRHRGSDVGVSYEVDTMDLSRPSVRLWSSRVWTSTRGQDSAEYRVSLTTTRPPFGGLRWWFLCPLLVSARPCGRRAGKLYLPPHGQYFGCRRCHDLTYTSCQESRKHDGLYRLLVRETALDFDTVKQVMSLFGKPR